MIKDIFLALIPVFVAVDAIGVLPIYVSLTRGLKDKEKKKVLLQSFITAVTLALVFIFVGKWIFAVLGITVHDFMIAGGIILFCIAIMDLLFPGKKRRMPAGELGAVPLGTPLIVGPAVLATSLIVVEHYGLLPAVISVVFNVFLAVLIFGFSGAIIKRIGSTGVNTFSRIMAILLASIAVMMIRKGLTGVIG